MEAEVQDRIADYLKAASDSNLILGVMLARIVHAIGENERVTNHLEIALEDFESIVRKDPDFRAGHDLVQTIAVVLRILNNDKFRIEP